MWTLRATVWMLKAIVWTLRAAVWMLRAIIWMLRAAVWMLRAIVWTLRAAVWMLRAIICPCRALPTISNLRSEAGRNSHHTILEARHKFGRIAMFTTSNTPVSYTILPTGVLSASSPLLAQEDP
eukprot:2581094-Pyramimonas_sp.AAC.1